MDSKKIRQNNRIIPKTQFVSTFNNNNRKLSKPDYEKYNYPGSLNNTASSSFQNQQKNTSLNNNNQSLNNNNNINLIPIKKTNELYPNHFNPKILETNGDKPLSRFGHSLVMINPIKICIFGGAVGEIRKMFYSNETFIYNIMTKIWFKLNLNNNQNILPPGRAAHAAAANDQMQMIIYGGSNNSGLIDDNLWILHLSEKNEGLWSMVEVVGPTPGGRYGHSISFMSPYFVLFGGNSNNSMNNDVWIIDIKKMCVNGKKLLLKMII